MKLARNREKIYITKKQKKNSVARFLQEMLCRKGGQEPRGRKKSVYSLVRVREILKLAWLVFIIKFKNVDSILIALSIWYT